MAGKKNSDASIIENEDAAEVKKNEPEDMVEVKKSEEVMYLVKSPIKHYGIDYAVGSLLVCKPSDVKSIPWAVELQN